MPFFIKDENRPITDYQLDDMRTAGTIVNTKSLEEQGIYYFDNQYFPPKYLENKDIFDVTAKDTNGIDQYEYFETTIEQVIPFSEEKITVTAKGYRFKWTLVAKSMDIIKPLLFARLAEKKHVVEDAGVKLSDGTVIQSAEADRNRIAQLMISLVYLKIFEPEDTEFKQYMDELEFKITEGTYRAITETEILYFFKVMAIRTLACFEREKVITKLIDTAANAEAMAAAFFDNIDLAWPL